MTNTSPQQAILLAHTMHNLLFSLAPLIFMLVAIKVIEIIVTHRRHGGKRNSAQTEKRETAIAALRSLGHSKTSAQDKVDASLKALGRKATIEEVIREAIRRSVAKQLEA